MSEKKVVDWGRVEPDFRDGVKTLRQIGAEHGITHVAVSKHAKKFGWVRAHVQREPRRSHGVPVPTVVRDQQERAGFVYVVSADECRLSKIGLTSNLFERLAAHQTSSPVELRVTISYFVENMRAEERALHAMFADKRVRGEWFELERADLETIAKRSLLA